MRQRFMVTTCLTALLSAAVAGQSGSAGQKPADAGHQGHTMQMTDGDFANMMVKHHRHGIAMAKMEESGGANAEVKALAAKIRQGQENDLPDLNAHAKKHKPSDMAAMHDKQMQKEQVASMAKLKSAKGASLDRTFVDEMIKHHQSALEMMKQTQFKDQDLKALADKMAKSQQAEIQELKKHQNH